MSNPSQKPNAALRAALRKVYLWRCLIQSVFAAIAGGLVVFSSHFFVSGMPKQVLSYVIIALTAVASAVVYALWSYRRIRGVIRRFKSVASPKSVYLDCFAVIRDRTPASQKRRLVGWLFLTDKGLYILPLARNEDAYFSIRLENIRTLEASKNKHTFRVFGGSIDGTVFTYDRDAVLDIIKGQLPVK